MAGAPYGNKNNAKGKQFEGALRAALNRGAGRSRLIEIADQLVTAAENGEAWAIQMVADRLDGKAKQQIEATGEGGGPLVVMRDFSGTRESEEALEYKDTPEVDYKPDPEQAVTVNGQLSGPDAPESHDDAD